MYLFNLKGFGCSNSCFKFIKSCIMSCNAVNSDCILKGLVSFNLNVVCLQIHPLAGDLMNLKLFLLHSASLHIVHSNFSFILYLYCQHVSVFINKPLTSSN